MTALILFRSLTYAQRGARLLERTAIRARLIRVPGSVTGSGCGYALRLPEEAVPEAAVILEREHILYDRILTDAGGGKLRERKP